MSVGICIEQAGAIRGCGGGCRQPIRKGELCLHAFGYHQASNLCLPCLKRKLVRTGAWDILERVEVVYDDLIAEEEK